MPGGDVRTTMKRHWKKLVAAVVVLVVLVLGGSWFYAKVWNQAPDRLSTADRDAALAATIPPTSPPASGPSTTPATAAETTAGSSISTSAAAPDGPEGVWQALPTSQVGYRVKESINGFDTEGVGRTNAVTGAVTIAGSTVTTAEFTVDMTTFKSDESRRDAQFNTRVMDVAQFPTATFTLTTPIPIDAVPAEGQDFKTSATGDLTLHGTTKPVTFDLSATIKDGKVGIVGNIPIVFADFNVPNPSIATIKTEDNGLLEFVLVFERP
jgi:polyisoprenoid-binding protein YceI